MDAPETESGEWETERAETLPEGAPLAFADRDPSALDGATELYLLDRHAAGDGTVRVQLLDWERDDDAVEVAYALPTGERLRDRYRWPTAGRYGESDFLALVRGLGYPPGGADLIAGEFARARNENGRWRIVTGRRGDREGSRGDGRGAGGERPIEARAAGVDGATDSGVAAELRRRVRRVGPMRAGTAAVALFALAVGGPAAMATLAGGLTAAATALGAALFAAALTTLWLAIAAAS